MITEKNLYISITKMSDEQLEQIIANSNDETEREVAHDILNKRYNERRNKINETAQKENMYDAIHQIAQDIRFMRNLMIAFIAIAVIAGIIVSTYIK